MISLDQTCELQLNICLFHHLFKSVSAFINHFLDHHDRINPSFTFLSLGMLKLINEFLSLV